jgi:hypothetical protein
LIIGGKLVRRAQHGGEGGNVHWLWGGRWERCGRQFAVSQDHATKAMNLLGTTRQLSG